MASIVVSPIVTGKKSALVANTETKEEKVAALCSPGPFVPCQNQEREVWSRSGSSYVERGRMVGNPSREKHQ